MLTTPPKEVLFEWGGDIRGIDGFDQRCDLTESVKCAEEVSMQSRGIRPTKTSFGTIAESVGKALLWIEPHFHDEPHFIAYLVPG